MYRVQSNGCRIRWLHQKALGEYYLQILLIALRLTASTLILSCKNSRHISSIRYISYVKSPKISFTWGGDDVCRMDQADWLIGYPTKVAIRDKKKKKNSGQNEARISALKSKCLPLSWIPLRSNDTYMQQCFDEHLDPARISIPSERPWPKLFSEYDCQELML